MTKQIDANKMIPLYKKLTRLLFMLLLLKLAAPVSYAQTNVVPDSVEFAVLKTMWETMGGSAWTNKTNWPTAGNWPASATAAQMDTWFGITVTNGDITGIALGNNKLNAPLPSSIGNLTALTSLTLNSNTLTGSIPVSVGNLANLVTLNLGNCALTGAIPSEIFNLTKVTALTLSTNNFSGGLPSNIGNCTALQSLLIANAKLSGTIPASINGLVNLVTLHLYQNLLTGSLPDMGALTKLKTLRLDENQLTGTIPTSWASMTELTSMQLNNNQLTGMGGLGGQINLKQLYLHNNQITGAIPAAVGNLINLDALYLYNNKLTGSIPESFSQLTKMQLFNARDNQLSGPIPPAAFGTWTAVTSILLDNNALTGPLPKSLRNCTSLQTLEVSNNQMSGEIPEELRYAPITAYYLSHNLFTGTIPAWLGTKTITHLDLAYNQFTTIPTELGNLKVSYVYLDHNRLSGAVPTELSNLRSVLRLDLSYNNLTSVPDMKASTTRLYIQQNMLDFASIERNMTGVGTHPYVAYSYSPQKNNNKITRQDIPLGSKLEIQAGPAGANGTYTWEKLNGSSQWVSVNSENQHTSQERFVINQVTASTAGTYRYKLTNTWSAALTLYSDPITVAVTDPLPANAPTTGLFNGLISNARWRTDKAQGSTVEYKGMYQYSYDDKYQVSEASWYDADPVLANSYVAGGNKFRLTGMSYDANGNIRTLKRYNGTGERIHDFTYSYATNKNQLTSISGYVNNYTYNALGQMTGEDKVNGDDQYVEYDVSGKVRKVFSDAAKTQLKVEYLYDDRGFRLAKKNYKIDGNQSAHVMTTWYIRNASGNVISTHEEQASALGVWKETEVPVYASGKVGIYHPQQDGSVSYEMTDHLGNVRAVVREAVNVYTATLEDNGQGDITNPRVQEMQYFQNVFETEKQDVHMNHTAPMPGVVENPNKSAYLFWQDGVAGMEAQDKSTGPAMMLEVNAGDKVDLEAWVKFEEKVSYVRDIDMLLLSQFLGSGFAYKGGFEGYTAAQTASVFQNALQGAGFMNDNGETNRPFAYLNYIVFDEQMNVVAGLSGRQRVPLDAGFQAGEEALPNGHRLMSTGPVTIGVKGYLYIWVSNESENTKVWFDDIKVTHTGTFVSKATDYGVWGDIIRESEAFVAEDHNKPLKESVIARYMFNTNANDGGSKNLHGVVDGATLTTDRNGVANAAYNFDGVNDKITLTGTEDDMAFVQNTGVFTISAYVKISNLNARSAIIGSSVTTTRNGFSLIWETYGSGFGDHQLRFERITSSTGVDRALSTQNAINDNNWHHIAVVGNGSVVKFYIDGNQDGADDDIVYFAGGNSVYPVLIGSTWSGGPALPMHGAIDDVQIFDRALTHDEIWMLMDGESLEEIDKQFTPQYTHRHGYQGQFSERDLETGWNHFELREYDPVVGRWTTFDPKRIGFSPYIGMANNPTRYTDPDGGGPDDTIIISAKDKSILKVIDDDLDDVVVVIDPENLKEYLKAAEATANLSNPNQIAQILRQYGVNYQMSYMFEFERKYKGTGWEWGAKVKFENNQVFISKNPGEHSTSKRWDYVNIWGSNDPREKANFHFHLAHPMALEGVHSSEDLKHLGDGIYNIVITPQNVYFYNRGTKRVNDFGKEKLVPSGYPNFSLPRSIFSQKK